MAQAQTWQWASAATSSSALAYVSAVAADRLGNTVVAGTFSGTLTLGRFSLTAPSGQAVFVGRLDAAGQWTQAAQSDGPAVLYHPTLDLADDGTVTLAGTLDASSTRFGAFTLTNAGFSSRDIFVARLSSAGQWVQAVRAGGSGFDEVQAMATDSLGNTVVAGYFSGPTASFGTTTLSTQGGNDLFVAKLSAAGQWTQATAVGGTGADFAEAVALDENGNVAVAGRFQSPALVFGPISLAHPSLSSTAMFVARLSAAGQWTQAVAVGNTGSTVPQGLALDRTGLITVAGAFNSAPLTFGSFTLSGATAGYYADDVFVARLSTAGQWTQVVQAGGSGFDEVRDVAADRAGNLTIAGRFSSNTLSFGPTTLVNANANATASLSMDVFVARLSATGTWSYAARAGSSASSEEANALALAPGGAVTVGGSFSGASTSFGSIPLVGVGSASAASGFAARLASPTTAAQPARVTALGLVPNPATGSVRLSWPTPDTQPLPVVVLDMAGREVYRQTAAPHATTATLDLRRLAPGLYVVRSGEAVGRLVVN